MARFIVGIGQTAVVTDPNDTIEMIGLGSCAGIFISVPGKVALAAHSLLALPRAGEKASEPGKYVETAVPYLVEQLSLVGVAKGRCRTWVVGGAQMFTFGSDSESAGIGTRNTDLAVTLLREHGFRPDVSHTGGTSARRASLEVNNGNFTASGAKG